jgi:hypothetical protein
MTVYRIGKFSESNEFLRQLRLLLSWTTSLKHLRMVAMEISADWTHIVMNFPIIIVYVTLKFTNSDDDIGFGSRKRM